MRKQGAFFIKSCAFAHIAGMKRRWQLNCAAACSALALLFTLPKVSQMSSLEELSLPHLGYYTCEEITLGGKEITADFSLLRIELKRDGKMLLCMRDALGRECTQEFSYEYTQGEEELLIRAQVGERTVERKLRFEDGAILFIENLGGKVLIAKFSRK